MSISEPFVRRPIATSLLMGGIFLVGLVVFPLLPVAPLPQVDFPTISGLGILAGRESGNHGLLRGDAARDSVCADPRPVADDLDAMRSGTTQITLQFDLNRNIDAAAQDVQIGHRCRRRPVAEESADAAQLSKGQSGRLAPS